MTLTPGRILVAILLIVGLAGTLVNGAAFYIRLLYLGGLLVLSSWWWTMFSLHGLKVERHARALRGSVGEIFEEHYEVANEDRLLKLWVEVDNETTLPNAAGSRVLTLLRGRQKRTYTARSWLTRRGGFLLGPTALTSGDPFGLFRITRRFSSRTSLVVLPMIFRVTQFLSPPGLLPGGKVIRRKSADVTPHAAGVREYVPGDAMKRIHWPTSIRRGQLMVKEFERDPQAEVWLFLDTQAGVHAEKRQEVPELPTDDLMLIRRPKFSLPPSTLEYAISITASLAHYFLDQRRAVGLVTAGQAYPVIPAERSERQESKILEALAFMQADGTLSLASLVTAQASQLPQGSSAILVTPTIWPELLLAVDDLQRRNLRPVVVLLMVESFGFKKSNESLADNLAQRGIPVCRVYCNADLPQTLSSFAATSFSQDMSWQRPVLSHLT